MRTEAWLSRLPILLTLTVVSACGAPVDAETVDAVAQAVSCSPSTSKASFDLNGGATNDSSEAGDISLDGRYVTFMSSATDMVPSDTSSRPDIFVRDRTTGENTRVSASSVGVAGNRDSFNPSITDDGRFIVFTSSSTNLVSGDTNAANDVFLWQRGGFISRVSVSSSELQANGSSSGGVVNGDGSVIAFSSFASNLVGGDTNGVGDVFVRFAGNTFRVSLTTSGTQANNSSANVAISWDGRYVAFQSNATNLVPGDTNGHEDTFFHDRINHQTFRINLSSSGAQANAAPASPVDSSLPTGAPSIGGPGGRYVAFTSFASNLVPGDTNGKLDVFVRDRELGTTKRISTSSSGTQGNDDSYSAKISADGRFVFFTSDATNLVLLDTNGKTDVFVRDLQVGTITLVSIGMNGAQSNNHSGRSGVPTGVTRDGKFVVFNSLASNLASNGATNGLINIFVRQLCP